MPRQAFKSISLIVSPFHCGTRAIGPGAGPLFLQTHGLVPALQQFGLPVHEFEIDPVDDFDGELAKSFEVIRRTSKLVSQARSKQSFPIILSGNCSGAVGVAAGLTTKTITGRELACVWFDAHDDFHTPDTIASGYGDSMPIAIMAGLCYKKLLQSVPGHQPLDLSNLVHVGMRDVTEEEKERVIDAGFDIVWGSSEKRIDFGSALDQVLRRKSLNDTMVHVDLDSLDASIGMANKMATFGGLLGEDLVECLTSVVERTNPVSLTLASFDPPYEGADRIARVGIEGVKVFLRALLGSV